MNTSCLRKKEKRIEVQWENSLLLPGCAGMPENVGLAGAYSGIVEGKLLVLGGANFPDKYPWEGGTKTWWSTLYSYDLQTGKWTVYDDFLDRPLVAVIVVHQRGVALRGKGLTLRLHASGGGFPGVVVAIPAARKCGDGEGGHAQDHRRQGRQKAENSVTLHLRRPPFLPYPHRRGPAPPPPPSSRRAG